jgi:hypothetical protein
MATDTPVALITEAEIQTALRRAFDAAMAESKDLDDQGKLLNLIAGTVAALVKLQARKTQERFERIERRVALDQDAETHFLSVSRTLQERIDDTNRRVDGVERQGESARDRLQRMDQRVQNLERGKA